MSSRGEIIATLERLGLKASKRRSQNFLFDDNHIRRIIEFCALEKGEVVLEIGPGLGALTDSLLSITDRYVGVELDRGLYEHLQTKYPQVRFVNADILTTDLGELFPGIPRKISIVSNLPYNISSEIIVWAIARRQRIDRAILLLQREVAERLAAPPGTRESGSLSLQLGLYARLELGPIVSGRCFFPAADVESRVLRIDFLETPLFDCDEGAFERIVRAAFSKRRKTILNSLSSSSLGLTREQVENSLASAQIDPKERAESVSLERFVKLVNAATIAQNSKPNG